jgi:hypothetical protein
VVSTPAVSEAEGGSGRCGAEQAGSGARSASS